MESLHEFEASREDWASYAERLQQYFAANDVESEGKQRAILLSACGAQTYQLLKNLLTPEKPTDKSFVQLVQLLKDHLQPKPSIIVERFTFHSRSRQEGESIAVFVAELKRLSENCGFGDTLNDMLRDRLVRGVNDGGMQRRLLSEPDLTYKKALDLTQAMEAAERNVLDLQSSKMGVEKAYLMKGVSRTNQELKCYRCGANHRANECRYKDLYCHSCGKQGHLSRVCRCKVKRSDTLSNRKETHQVQSDFNDTQESEEYALFKIHDSSLGPLRVTAMINGVKLALEVDTGAPNEFLWEISTQPFRFIGPSSRFAS